MTSVVDITLAGVDEAGRGPWAGPVVAAAVVLPPSYDLPGLCDSKALSPQARERLALAIQEQAVAWSLGEASVERIDRTNILRATLWAMQQAVEGLGVALDAVWVDGLHVPTVAAPAKAVVRGDQNVPAISAASILAKVARDAACLVLAERFPGYGFERHKGYGTPQHREALQRLGPCPAHRRSFRPVAACLHQVTHA